MRSSAAVVMVAATLVSSHPAAHADPYANAPAYARALDTATTTIRPFLTTGRRIPLTDGVGTYLVVGIPDGLGLYRKGERLILLSNHEFLQKQGGPAGPLRGGARVSEFTLSIEERATGREIVALSGRAAIEHVYEGARMVTDTTRRFGKLCSATLADQRVGFDRPVFISSEELSAGSTFDPRGGQAYAVFGGNAYALPRLGRFRGENRVPVPFTGSKTVVFGLEDDDRRGQFSQLYMYVGEKQPKSSVALAINGLDKGSLFVFAAAHSSVHDESHFKARGDTLAGGWKRINWALADSALEDAAQAANALDFVRVEDGAANPMNPGEFWFVTTGAKGNHDNPFGRLYRLNFDPKDPSKNPARLTLALVGERNGIVSPDNIDINRHGEIAICEDPNYELESDLGLSRDTRLWIYDIAGNTLTAVAELDRGAARGHALAADAGNSSAPEHDKPGGWEFSGVVDAEDYLGRGAWILDVQAHSLRIEPVTETVEGGQYLQVIWKPKAPR